MEELKLKPSEKKLLQVAVEAGQADTERLTVKGLANSVGKSPLFVYKRLQNESFRGLFIEALKTSLVVEAPAILKMFADMAKQGSFKHGKLILEIAGIYKEETKVDLTAKITAESPFASDEEKIAFAKATLSKYIEETGGEVVDIE